MPNRIRTLPLTHPLRREIETAFGFGPFRAISHVSVGGGGACYWNVAARVDLLGGSSVSGWKIQYWPDLFAVAVHHAVWRNPLSNELVDVTAKIESDTEPGTTFVVDPTHEVHDLSRAPFILDRYYLLAERPEVCELVAARNALLEHQRALAKRLFAAGATWRPVGGYELDHAQVALFQNDFDAGEQHTRRAMRAIEACDRI